MINIFESGSADSLLMPTFLTFSIFVVVNYHIKRRKCSYTEFCDLPPFNTAKVLVNTTIPQIIATHRDFQRQETFKWSEINICREGIMRSKNIDLNDP